MRTGSVWHRLQHWLQIEPCQNFTEWRGDELWHVVVCVVCGARVLAFPASISDRREPGEEG
jgi:hypothetical protein